MKHKTVMMAEEKTIAIVAHDNKKQDLLAWAEQAVAPIKSGLQGVVAWVGMRASLQQP